MVVTARKPAPPSPLPTCWVLPAWTVAHPPVHPLAPAMVLPAWTPLAAPTMRRGTSRCATSVDAVYPWRQGSPDNTLCYHHGQGLETLPLLGVQPVKLCLWAGRGRPWTVCATSMDCPTACIPTSD